MSTVPCVDQSHGFSFAHQEFPQSVWTPDAGSLCSNCVFHYHCVFELGRALDTGRMYYDHGVDKRVYIGGAADFDTLRSNSLSSSRCLSYSGGILSEGDKRDSKGDMPRPFSSHQQTDERGRLGRGYFAPEPASRTRPRRILYLSAHRLTNPRDCFAALADFKRLIEVGPRL